jgi:hypothetical protein
MKISRIILLSSLVLFFSILLTDYFMLNRRIVTQVARTTRQQGHLILNSSRTRINTAYTGTALAGFSLFSTTPSNMGLFSGNKNQVDNDQAPKEPAVKKSDSEWQAQLSPEQFRVLRKQGTERPGTGEYNKFKEEGVYREYLGLFLTCRDHALYIDEAFTYRLCWLQCTSLQVYYQV